MGGSGCSTGGAFMLWLSPPHIQPYHGIDLDFHLRARQGAHPYECGGEVGRAQRLLPGAGQGSLVGDVGY